MCPAAVLIPLLTLAQVPNPAPAPSVIRLDVNLVEVDAVVTDSRGKRVADLPSSAFDILQDGKPREITNFSYVSSPSALVHQFSTPRTPPKLNKGEVPPPTASAMPSVDVHRTIAIVVDDVGIAVENIPHVHDAIKRFLDDQMRPGDLVAIVGTGGTMGTTAGALAQFTSDKRQLYAALDRVQIVPRHFTLFGQLYTMGTLGTVRLVANSMQQFPGRKSIILFSQRIQLVVSSMFLTRMDAVDDAATEELRKVIDAANRVSISIYPIDARGLQSYEVSANGRMARRGVVAARQNEGRTQDGMAALAEATGGLFLHDTNDLASAFQQAADDGDGYYLIGYHPDPGELKDDQSHPKFHNIEVRVKIAGLHVRSRKGFYSSPFGNTESLLGSRSMHPRLTAGFFSQSKTGSSIDALLSFHPGDLKWSTDLEAIQTASIDITASFFDDHGLALRPIDTTFPLKLSSREYDDAVQHGLVYALRIPVKQPGPYLVRTTVRDPATGAGGSAEQYIDVPDVEHGHLALSAIGIRDAATQAKALSDRPGPQVDQTGGAASRRFHRGTNLVVAYEVINAKSDATGRAGHPELEVETRLFHDSVRLMENATRLGDDGPAPDPKRLGASGHLSLGELPSGEYTLQVIVNDKLANPKFATATQSIDFEIEP